jgi:hypothetical protein
MKQFKDFGIKPEVKSFTGDKIKVERILNREVVVHDYRIEDSKYQGKGNGKCLYLQISIGETKHVVFSGSVTLMQMIERVPKADFPFQTTIVKENERLEFK